MNRNTSLIVVSAAYAVFLPSARADFLTVFGASAAIPAGSIVLSTTSPVANAAGEGVAAFNVAYFSGSSGVTASRFDSSGSVQTLGSLGAGGSARASSSVTTITASGLALGYSTEASSANSTRAVYWLPGSTTPTKLNSINDYFSVIPGQSNGVANAVNAGGLIVGSSGKFSADGYDGLGTRAVYWAAGSTTPTELGNLGTNNGTNDNTGVTYSAAMAVNSSNVIAGYAKYTSYVSNTTSVNAHAVRWTPSNTAAVDLGVLNYSNGDAATGNSNSLATAINTGGTIIGSSLRYDLARYATTPNGNNGYVIGNRAVRWAPGSTTPTELQPLNTTTFDVNASFSVTYAGTGNATANDINDAGTTVGVSTLYAPQTGVTSASAPSTYGTRAVTWAAGSTTPMELPYLGTLDSGTTTYTSANAINEDAVIAGNAYLNGSYTAQRGVVWRADRSIVDLNGFVNPASGYVLNSATSISEGLTTNSYTVTGLATLSGSTVAYLVNVPRPMYFANSVGGDLANVSGGKTNFATNVAGTNVSTMLPAGGNDIFFASTNAPQLTTTLASNLAVNSLTFGTGASATSPVTINGSGTLTLNGGLSVTYAAGVGIVKQAGSAAVTINTPVAVAANQTWTNSSTTALTVGGVGLGANTLTIAGTGPTTLSGTLTGTGSIVKTATGTLRATQPAYAAILSGTGGIDLRAGRFDLAYGSSTSPVAQVKAILGAGYAQSTKFGSGQIRSTGLAANLTLGYGDAGGVVSVMVTLPGDANLDGSVNFSDFLALQTNFNTANTTFGQGNFNYDGITDFSDFLVLQTNFGQSLNDTAAPITSAEYAAVTAFGLANAVPEPASVALLGMASAALMRRRRRSQ